MSRTKDFKTTIFGHSRDDVVEILRKVCVIVGEDLQPVNLSYTEGRIRPSLLAIWVVEPPVSTQLLHCVCNQQI